MFMVAASGVKLLLANQVLLAYAYGTHGETGGKTTNTTTTAKTTAAMMQQRLPSTVREFDAMFHGPDVASYHRSNSASRLLPSVRARMKSLT